MRAFGGVSRQEVGRLAALQAASAHARSQARQAAGKAAGTLGNSTWYWGGLRYSKSLRGALWGQQSSPLGFHRRGSSAQSHDGCASRRARQLRAPQSFHPCPTCLYPVTVGRLTAACKDPPAQATGNQSTHMVRHPWAVGQMLLVRSKRCMWPHA